VMGLVSFAHAQEECPNGQYRAASGDCVPRPNKGEYPVLDDVAETLETWKEAEACTVTTQI
jgi:hypothetical protein